MVGKRQEKLTTAIIIEKKEMWVKSKHKIVRERERERTNLPS